MFKSYIILCNQLTNIRCSSKKNTIENIVYKISFSYNRIYKDETISHGHHKDMIDGQGSHIEIKEGHYHNNQRGPLRDIQKLNMAS